MAAANSSTSTPKHDLTGRAFGKLTAIHFVSGGKWLCKCECGAQPTVWTSSLLKGLTKSCGCAWHLTSGKRTHGLTNSAEYKVWCGIKRRCLNPNDKTYPAYGGSGITICERWRDSFEAFIADMGKRPSDKHEIDRYPNQSGNYEPGNCRWATRTHQARNRRSNVFIFLNGETKTLAEWAEIYGVGYSTIKHRLKVGWSVEAALRTPVASR